MQENETIGNIEKMGMGSKMEPLQSGVEAFGVDAPSVVSFVGKGGVMMEDGGMR